MTVMNRRPAGEESLETASPAVLMDKYLREVGSGCVGKGVWYFVELLEDIWCTDLTLSRPPQRFKIPCVEKVTNNGRTHPKGHKICPPQTNAMVIPIPQVFPSPIIFPESLRQIAVILTRHVLKRLILSLQPCLRPPVVVHCNRNLLGNPAVTARSVASSNNIFVGKQPKDLHESFQTIGIPDCFVQVDPQDHLILAQSRNPVELHFVIFVDHVWIMIPDQ